MLTYPLGCGGAHIDHGLTAGSEPLRQVSAKTTCIFDGLLAFGKGLAPAKELPVSGQGGVDAKR